MLLSYSQKECIRLTALHQDSQSPLRHVTMPDNKCCLQAAWTFYSPHHTIRACPGAPACATHHIERGALHSPLQLREGLQELHQAVSGGWQGILIQGSPGNGVASRSRGVCQGRGPSQSLQLGCRHAPQAGYQLGLHTCKLLEDRGLGLVGLWGWWGWTAACSLGLQSAWPACRSQRLVLGL